MGHVYLIGSRTFKWYKIGKSSNAAIRVSDLGILLPFRIEVIAVWKVPNPHTVEKMLHVKHAASRINGEWFMLSSEEQSALVAEMSYAAVDTASGFCNLEEDFAPKGTQLQHRFKPKKINTLSLEECERRKQARIKKSKMTPQEREQRKQESFAARDKRKAELLNCIAFMGTTYGKFLTVH